MRIFKAFALTGRRAKCCLYPGCCPGLGASALTGRVGHCFCICFVLLLGRVDIAFAFASFCFWGAAKTI